MQFKAENLDKMDFFGKSDPFLVIGKCNGDQSYSVVYRTEVIRKNLNPSWKTFSIPVRKLCNGDRDRFIKFECRHWNKDGDHTLIGEFVTSLRALEEGPGSKTRFNVVHPQKKVKKKNYKSSGIISLMSCTIEEEMSFFDYIKGGTQIHFTVAIDFTASNGNPKDSRSLHYMSPNKPNTYATAIQAVGEIVQDYDSDKLFPALGFGARILPEGRLSHEFYLNGHPTNPYCKGVDGILDAYHRTLKTVELFGPTNFAPVIKHVARFARALQDGSHYFILLIITDGILSDLQQTKDAIVSSSSLPMSIIIVGVGNADFTAMEILDADNDRLANRHGVLAERDIVQFVPLKKFVVRGNWLQTKSKLAKEVMAEVPDQLVEFMRSKGILPKTPAVATATWNSPILDSSTPSTSQTSTSPSPGPPPFPGDSSPASSGTREPSTNIEPSAPRAEPTSRESSAHQHSHNPTPTAPPLPPPGFLPSLSSDGILPPPPPPPLLGTGPLPHGFLPPPIANYDAPSTLPPPAYDDVFYKHPRDKDSASN